MLMLPAVLLSLLGGASAAPVAPQHAAGGNNPSDDAVAATLRTQDFIHIPGPNPILTVGANGTWDANVIECAGGVYAEYDSAQPAPARAAPTLALFIDSRWATLGSGPPVDAHRWTSRHPD